MARPLLCLAEFFIAEGKASFATVFADAGLLALVQDHLAAIILPSLQAHAEIRPLLLFFTARQLPFWRV